MLSHEDSASSIAHEVATYENSSMSNIEDDAHEDIPSSVGEYDATIDGDTPSEAIKEEFDSFATDNANAIQ